MSINPIEDNSTPKTTGSLEELFRHHLGEEAAVPPRPMLWDQIDNSLLIRQNEVYRKRLVATRWVAAASLLLATLAGTGWWSLRDARLGGTEVATGARPAGAPAGTGMAGISSATGTSGQVATTSGDAGQAAATGVNINAPATAANASNGALRQFGGGASRSYAYSTAQPAAAGTATQLSGTGSALNHNGLNTRLNAAERGNGAFTASIASTSATATDAVSVANQSIAARATQAPAAGNTTGSGNATSAAGTAFGTTEAVAATASLPVTASATGAIGTTALPGSSAAASAALAQTGAAVAPEQLSLLAARSAALDLNAPAALPNGLAKVTVPTEPVAAMDAHRWHYGASYTASVFNPNINFSRTGIEPEYGYNPALGAGSPALTENAATQYRQNLRAGISQRIALLATRHLAGHWSLSTGAEFSQATAKSASSTAFVGEQLPDLGQSDSGPMRTTDFRYRLASVPLEVRYTNPVKRGWSLYGRLGGVVSALLGARSEVEGNPEATRTYSFMSAGMPYRRVLGSLRGGAGAQFRANTGKWTLSLGPVAELGLTPMNAHPAQHLFSQSRAYSFGVEAGMEFGR